MITETEQYDVVIAGGGMTGATLAIALAQLQCADRPYRIALIDAQKPPQPVVQTHSAFDGRAIALSAGSVDALGKLMLWQLWEPVAHAIHHIHVSGCGHAGRVTIDADEFGLPSLGHVLELAVAGPQLYKRIKTTPNIHHYCPAVLHAFEQQSDSVMITLSSGEVLSARLLVGAEGAQSVIQQQLQLPVHQHDFLQSALITTLEVDQPIHGRAWERFTSEGPLALLPLGDNTYSVVWCQSPVAAANSMEQSDEWCLRQLQQQFGYRAGRFLGIGSRAIYPLSLRYLPQTTHHRVVLLGNAAHQLHPVAGQGFNLAMRDIMSLQQVLRDSVDPGAYPVLQQYRQRREADQQRTIWLTSSLASLFGDSSFPLVINRQLGLMLMNRLSCLKDGLVQQALGYQL